MRKASKILCLVGGILGIVLALLWFILAIVQFVFGGFAAAVAAGSAADIPESVQQWLVDYVYAHGGPGAFPNGWEDVAAKLFAQGALYIVMMLFCIPSAIISFILSKKEKTGLPLPIVLAVLSWSGNVAAFAGAALAIVNWAIVERKEGQEEPKEEPKEE